MEPSETKFQLYFKYGSILFRIIWYFRWYIQTDSKAESWKSLKVSYNTTRYFEKKFKNGEFFFEEE